MISVSQCWIFYFFICSVQRTETVKIFKKFASSKAPVTIFEPSVKSKTCLLKPQSGPCRSRIRMYYFDPTTSECTTFNWGGCQGNGNRFETASECNDYCMSKPGKVRPRYCSLTFDYGFCFGAVQRWYYDSKWKVCKETIYSGCGGNKNNFYNLEQCEAICRFGGKPLSSKLYYSTDLPVGKREGPETSIYTSNYTNNYTNDSNVFILT